MSLPLNTVRLFQKALYLWVLGYLLSAIPASEWLWEHPVSPSLPGPSMPAAYLTDAFNMWIPDSGLFIAVTVVLLLCIQGLIGTPQWWMAAVTWVLFTSLMNRAWLAGSGGQQLMSNLLFWNIMLCIPKGRDGSVPWTIASLSAFWILRLQVVLAYLVTAVHKLTGSMWLDGSAMGVIASDPSFGPAWIAGYPDLARLVSWSVLAFQITFPIAVWFRRIRPLWLSAGIVFHVATMISIGIPEMGAAFIAAYAIWSEEEQAGRILDRLPHIPRRSLLTARP